MGARWMCGWVGSTTLLAVGLGWLYGGQPSPTQSQALVERGRYLVTVAGCNDCHTPHRQGEPDMSRQLAGHPENLKMPLPPKGKGPWQVFMAGTQTAFAGPWGISYAANLTPDNETGIGLWTEEQFIKAMRTGRSVRFGRPIMPPMPWQTIAQMTDEDLRAIFAYLHTLKPIKNRVPPSVPLHPLGKPPTVTPHLHSHHQQK